MEINKIMKQIHENNIEKGFWENKETKNVGELLMLCVSELAEALEADRKNRHSDINSFLDRCEEVRLSYNEKSDEISDNDFKLFFENNLKDTFEDEIADTVIRLFDLAAGLNIDLERHIEVKFKYNKMRAYKHGKNY